MDEMFMDDENFNQDISEWNVSKVTSMSGMFRFADKFNYDISKWDVRNVIDMENMFGNASQFNQSLAAWNVPRLIKFGASKSKITALFLIPETLIELKINNCPFLTSLQFDKFNANLIIEYENTPLLPALLKELDKRRLEKYDDQTGASDLGFWGGKSKRRTRKKTIVKTKKQTFITIV